MNNVNDFIWGAMVMELQGVRLNNFGANTVAQTLCGEVKSATVYEKLTERLATPNHYQKLDVLQYPKTH